MNKYIPALCILMMGTLLLTSCLKSDDDSDITYYNDTAITAFSVATVNRYIHTTSSTGGDSVYKKTLSNPVKFVIDQYKKEIYNTDSLYVDCDLSHVLLTITALNGGVVAVKSMTSDSLTIYSSTDSLDFSQPRVLRVVANDGRSYRDYTVTLNKHQVETDKLLWQKMEPSDYPTGDKALWEDRVKAAGLKAYIGSTDVEGYAFNNDGQLMYSQDKGLNWEQDVLDDDSSLLPANVFAFVSWVYDANRFTYDMLLVGVSEQVTEACVVWRRLDEYADFSEPAKWSYLPREPYNRYYLPRADHLSLVYYHGYVLAFSSDGNVYQSRDHGITWKTYDRFSYPSESYSYAVEAVTDDNGFIWTRNIDNGEVWRGSLIEE